MKDLQAKLRDGSTRYGRENASGKLIVSGGDSDKVAFVHCRTCDEGIGENKIKEHLQEGHTVEKTMKVEK